ncbi:hypothetical protein D3C74_381570 [compost metagenome]
MGLEVRAVRRKVDVLEQMPEGCAVPSLGHEPEDRRTGILRTDPVEGDIVGRAHRDEASSITRDPQAQAPMSFDEVIGRGRPCLARVGAGPESDGKESAQAASLQRRALMCGDLKQTSDLRRRVGHDRVVPAQTLSSRGPRRFACHGRGEATQIGASGGPR